ncbi:MAG: diguanylate cyclase domain-containing protein [Eubacteriales bacterium]
MKSLKSIAKRKLWWLITIMMSALFIISFVFQFTMLQNNTRENAGSVFSQTELMIEENQTALKALEEQFAYSCIRQSQTLAYMISENPEILGNIEEFRRLARMLEVDEICIFNETGKIITGTHSEFFGLTFDSGEQMAFFKPMLDDKNLILCQDITPNTAEGRLVQYAAVWTEDGKYIVQVGIYPDEVLKAREKCEFSYVYFLLRGKQGVNLYAIDSKTGEIVGSTVSMSNGKSISSIGIEPSELNGLKRGAHHSVGGVNSFCVTEEANGIYMLYTLSNDQMYENVWLYTVVLFLCMLAVGVTIVCIINFYTKKHIIGSIHATNELLGEVAAGNLGKRVDVHTFSEFSELSNHINYMIHSLLAETDKMNLVLNRTNLRVGVYEYNPAMKNVRYTEHVPCIFGVTEKEMAELSSDYKKLQGFIDELRQSPVENAENTYHISGKNDIYVKLEEITSNNTTLGIAVDVTKEVENIKRAEAERDIDTMTGILNRRGVDHRFEQIFSKPYVTKSGALIMIDTDNLKEINDTYGHTVGDLYLRTLADMLKMFPAPNTVAGRLGGDEFVLLIYGYSTDIEVLDALMELKKSQDATFVTLEDGRKIKLDFSYGYELIRGRTDHELMLSTADAYMYNSKRMRKEMRKNTAPEEHN